MVSTGNAVDNLAILNEVNTEVTQEALISNVNSDLQKVALDESKKQLANWEASQRKATVEEEEEDLEDFEDDDLLRELTQKRLADMKSRYAEEKKFHAQGHGEYREIVEEEFLKEVCGSAHVVCHFYHREFVRCKIVDKHMRILAPKHRGCKFVTIDAEKSPFFVAKLKIQMLPTVIVFKDGKVVDQLIGFDELNHTDEFRTEVLEHWLSKAGCIKMKVSDMKKLNADSDSDYNSDDD